ncbi:hypothetical protein PR202_ga26916 [Eleusine coracana subsp. coracana]|uniref:Uncharacterized protein n=1 Tax=Eleusine coracana subsp. coracana TaxID=191504 RepID=A0AAV5DDA2_ELECO|nr:hypothetical protein PR202_ga26916 [Eleusine coracana subsp. coracana]
MNLYAQGMVPRMGEVVVALYHANVGAFSEFSANYCDNWRKGAVVDLSLGLGRLFEVRTFVYSDYRMFLTWHMPDNFAVNYDVYLMTRIHKMLLCS